MKPSHPIPYEYQLEELRQYDGISHKQMYVSIKSVVYDVTSSQFFVPEKGYGMLWGGRDATYALAKMSLKPEHANEMDLWEELDDKSLIILEDWVRETILSN